MAKISPVSIKYMIHASFKAEGPLERPDVIGAIFGQTEGLLGNELEMRELQKEGRIGRIEVDLEIVDGKSIGEINVPTAMDKSETTLIAAALETIDRIGPTEAEIKIVKIEDVRGSKRDFIIDRAKQLLEGLDSGGDLGEMSRALKEESRAAKIQEYGGEKLPAGDLTGNEIIVVEGRADVINLLKNRVNNVIGMNGTKLPAEIARLGQDKELTLFIDGDRGGKLIARNVINNAKIVYVAVAPDGKEVEELAGKEILIALRKKLPTDEFLRRLNSSGNGYNSYEAAEEIKEEPPSVDEDTAKKKIRGLYEGISGSKSALLVDNNFDVIRKVGNREVPKNIELSKKRVFAIVLDGTVTGTLIKTCEDFGVTYLGATNFGNVKDTRLKLVSL
ncbi:MAG: DNA primase DnaG [Nanoarchaeota archaeon]|nr:DNA primase DnaG [Nanoarchaeota archaeon]